jgi:hypothetical protein
MVCDDMALEGEEREEEQKPKFSLSWGPGR